LKSAGKKTVAKTETPLIVGIPVFVRFRPIVVEPQTVVIVFQLEDVRIAVGVGSVRTAINATARLKMRRRCMFFVIKNQPAVRTKFFLFMDSNNYPPQKACCRLRSQ
jgi:hypothetical protein